MLVIGFSEKKDLFRILYTLKSKSNAMMRMFWFGLAVNSLIIIAFWFAVSLRICRSASCLLVAI